jgi:hypothetical protein
MLAKSSELSARLVYRRVLVVSMLFQLNSWYKKEMPILKKVSSCTLFHLVCTTNYDKLLKKDCMNLEEIRLPIGVFI